ncbi:hypothetical protein [Rhizobium giardinii]|uniref:hypothetical protein n=1 Tax=Rhizobium giardinii TaxID=56731 RepID=UPI0039E1F419
MKSDKGNDPLYGSACADVLDSALGNDKIVAGNGGDVLFDLGGNNTFTADDGSEKIGISVFEAHTGGDTTTLDLGAGHDVVEFNAVGGSGTDLAQIDRSETTMALSFTLERECHAGQRGRGAQELRARQHHRWFGADKFTGGNLSDTLDGNDALSGLGGDDWLSGGSKDDILQGRGGDDTLIGRLRRRSSDRRLRQRYLPVQLSHRRRRRDHRLQRGEDNIAIDGIKFGLSAGAPIKLVLAIPISPVSDVLVAP